MPDDNSVQAVEAVDNLSGVKRRVLDRILRGDLSSWLNSQAEISRRPDKDLVAPPLSTAQEHFLVDEDSSLDVPPYNETISLRLRGPLVVDVLEQCLRVLIRKHEIFRTTYSRRNGRLFQVIRPVPETPLFTVVDLS